LSEYQLAELAIDGVPFLLALARVVADENLLQQTVRCAGACTYARVKTSNTMLTSRRQSLFQSMDSMAIERTPGR
jgi:hypothetical protein